METEGMTFDEIEVPADMLEEAKEWRQNLIEAVYMLLYFNKKKSV